MRFEVVSKEAGLGLDGKKVRLLVYVFDQVLGDYGESVRAVVPQSCQRYQRGRRSAGGAYYFFLSDFTCRRSERCLLSYFILSAFLELQNARASSDLSLCFGDISRPLSYGSQMKD